MSPPPLRTSTETCQGVGSAALPCGVEPPRPKAATRPVTSTATSVRAAPPAIQRPKGRRAGGEDGVEGLRAVVGDLLPRRSRDQDRVEAGAGVGGGDDVGVSLAPARDHAVDCLGRQLGPVAEYDDRGLGLRWKRAQATAEG